MDGGDKKISYDVANYTKGIIKKNDTFIYTKDNTPISSDDINRIKSLKIPPAWINVWISADPKSKIQVIGTDTSGRKQYIYHTSHIKHSETKKFTRLSKFIKKIPKLNNAISKHLHLNAYDKNHVIATMLNIIKELYMRVGKETYAKENRSYGISSLMKKHIKILGNLIIFRFKGKSNQRLYYSLKDNVVKNHLQQLLKLDGKKLFQYIDKYGNIHKITDLDINKYIQTFMGNEFTVKDFRTYGANYYFIKFILNETIKRIPKNQKIIKKNILNAVKLTAHYLRHTKNISKKSYIMNFCIDFYIKNPDFFIIRKFEDPSNVLKELLHMYIKKKL